MSVADVERACAAAKGNEQIDDLHRELLKFPPAQHEYQHLFTHDSNGNINLYGRVMTKPRGTLSISKIHKTEHFYFLMKGVLFVFDIEAKKWIRFEGPFVGITKPGTRRISYSKTRCVLATTHVTDTDNLEEIEDQVICRHEVPIDFDIPPIPS